MSAQEILDLGAAAKNLAESEMFKMVVEHLKRDSFEAWKKTQPDHGAAREDLYHFYVALSHIEEKLKAMQDSAKVEQKKLEHPKPKVSDNEVSE